MENDPIIPEGTDADGDAEVTTDSFERVSAGTSYGDGADKQKVEAEVNLKVGADITEAIELYGEEVVYERYRRGVVKDCGNAIRSALNKHLNDPNTDPEEVASIVEKELAGWRPDVTRKRAAKSTEEDIFSKFGSLSAEKQAEILAQLRAKAEAATEG